MSSEQSIDRNDREIKYSNIVEPKLIHTPEQTQQSDTKPTEPRPYEIEMSDMAARNSSTNNYTIGNDDKDSRISIVNDQADKELQKDDDKLLPNQDAIVDEVSESKQTCDISHLIILIKHRMANHVPKFKLHHMIIRLAD